MDECQQDAPAVKPSWNQPQKFNFC